VFYSQGTVDWSGTHLTSVGDLIAMFLGQRMDLNGDAVAKYREHIDESHKSLEKQRFPTWHLLKAAMGTGAGPASPFIKDAVARMEEAPYPKVGYAIDRRVTQKDFCMSPYPSLPWKNDWMKYPEQDRTQSLYSYPLFEARVDIMYWKVGFDYRAGGSYETPGPDFLHLYWYARKFGLISATD
jgi:hypothetical protein